MGTVRVIDSFPHLLLLDAFGLKRCVLGALPGSENGEERAVRGRELSESGAGLCRSATESATGSTVSTVSIQQDFHDL